MKRYWAKPKDLFETLPKNYKEGYDCIRLMRADEVDTWITKRIARLKWKIQDAEGDRSLQMFYYEEFVAELEQIAGK